MSSLSLIKVRLRGSAWHGYQLCVRNVANSRFFSESAGGTQRHGVRKGAKKIGRGEEGKETPATDRRH